MFLNLLQNRIRDQFNQASSLFKDKHFSFEKGMALLQRVKMIPDREDHCASISCDKEEHIAQIARDKEEHLVKNTRDREDHIAKATPDKEEHVLSFQRLVDKEDHSKREVITIESLRASFSIFEECLHLGGGVCFSAMKKNLQIAGKEKTFNNLPSFNYRVADKEMDKMQLVDKEMNRPKIADKEMGVPALPSQRKALRFCGRGYSSHNTPRLTGKGYSTGKFSEALS